MPRTRVTETAPRQSLRGPPSLRTSSSDSDPSHTRPRTQKLADGRSPRGTQSHPLNQKKLGTRIADLESQLGLAQEELKSLKDQLVSTEAAKKTAQDRLEKKSKKQQKVPEAVEIKENHSSQTDTQELSKNNSAVSYETSDIEQETDVFEVTIDQKVNMDPKADVELPVEEEELKPTSVSLPTESPAVSEPSDPLFDELASKNDEISLLKSSIDEKEKELEALRQENKSFKSQLDEKSTELLSAQSEISELTLKVNKVNEELETSKSYVVQINKKLEATEKAKEELEDEMKMLRVQSEQWRKAADAAASVLAGGVEMNGRRISERCGSMDKLMFDHGGYGGYVGSPRLMDDSDDVFGGEKRKGIRMFGDLWKKKGQK